MIPHFRGKISKECSQKYLHKDADRYIKNGCNNSWVKGSRSDITGELERWMRNLFRETRYYLVWPKDKAKQNYE